MIKVCGKHGIPLAQGPGLVTPGYCPFCVGEKMKGVITMNPWHSTDHDKPCRCEGCDINGGMGHQPKEVGGYWYIYKRGDIPEIMQYDRFEWWNCDDFGTKVTLQSPLFYRIPDGHPDLPEVSE